jgi:hypothetical protein
MTEEIGGENTPDAADRMGSTPVPSGEGYAGAGTASPFSSGEGMVSFGGWLLIAAYVIFEFIWEEYFFSFFLVLLAVLAVVLPRASRAFVEKIAPLSVLMKAVGYMIAIIGILTITWDVRHATSALDDVPEILGALVTYAGFAIAYLGARSIEVD